MFEGLKLGKVLGGRPNVPEPEHARGQVRGISPSDNSKILIEKLVSN